jgi:hypothetical protein
MSLLTKSDISKGLTNVYAKHRILADTHTPEGPIGMPRPSNTPIDSSHPGLLTFELTNQPVNDDSPVIIVPIASNTVENYGA